jgi:hypothetical protein
MKKFNYLLLDNELHQAWNHVIDVFNHVDPEKVLTHTLSDWKPYVLEPKYKYVIKSFGYRETPRLSELITWCNLNPGVRFIALGDFWLYDFLYPSNLEFVEYRFAYIELAQLLHIFRHDIKPVKNKKFKYKFSSLSNRTRQFRAVVTAKLLSVAKQESLISWHNQNNDQSGIHEYLIDSVKNMDYFDSLDWSFLEKSITADDWTPDKNDVCHLISNTNYPAYEEAFINFNNETFWFGWHHIDSVKYTTPGPYLSEKTWKCIASGTMFINTGQPFTYKFLRDVYGIPIDFDIDLSFDEVIGDIDRMKSVCNLIDNLSNRSLNDLIDCNIDACEKMQQWAFQPDLTHQFEHFNKKQDQLILEKISR